MAKKQSVTDFVLSLFKDKTVEAKERLASLGKSIVTNPDFQPRDGKTFCNKAVQFAAKAFDCNTFTSEMLATDMIKAMATSKEWKLSTASEALIAATNGGFVVATLLDFPHSHVALVSSEKAVWSNKWTSSCPTVYNVGPADKMNLKESYTVGENFAFGPKPVHYVYLPSLQG
jgi:hypothetical protein